MVISIHLLKEEQTDVLKDLTNEIRELRRDEDKNFYLINQRIELESSRTRTYLKERIDDATDRTNSNP